MQRSLGNAEQNRAGFGWLHPFLCRGLFVHRVELDPVNLFADQEHGVARIGDFDLLQHLADNHFDVLVVDFHALQAVDVLHFVNQILRQRRDAQHVQNVVRHRVAFHQQVAFFDKVAFANRNVPAFRDQIFRRVVVIIRIPHDDTAFGFVVSSELYPARRLAQDSMVLWLAGLEQFRNARQTAGDVAGFGAFPWDTGKHVARAHPLAIGDGKHCIDAHEVARFQAIRQVDYFAGVVAQSDPRAKVCAARLLAPIDNDTARDARRLVRDFTHRNAFGQVDIVGGALGFRNNRQGVGVPLRQFLAGLDGRAFVGKDTGTIGQPVPGAFPVVFVDQDDFAVPRHDHRNIVGVDDDIPVYHLDRSRMGRLDRGLLRTALGRTADVEGAHGQLRSRLADRLCRDNADSLADIGGGAAGKVAPVAGSTDTGSGLAGKRRAYFDLVYASGFDGFGHLFVDDLAGRDHDFAGQRMNNVFGRAAAQNTLRQSFDDVAAIDDSRHGQATGGAAILLCDDAVLGDINQPAGKVAGVSRFQRGVGQAFPRAVGGVEVLQHRQAFFEVRDNRRFDNLARRLGHQAAHTGQLLHLRFGATGAGVRHHVDSVDRVTDFLLLDRLHHLCRDFVGDRGPGIDDLVVLFALRDQAFEVLLLELFYLGLRLVDQAPLRIRNNQIVLAEGNAGERRIAEACGHQAVAEDHRLFLTACAVDIVDQGGDGFLGQNRIDPIIGHARLFRQQLGQRHAARRRIDRSGDFLAGNIQFMPAHFDFRVPGQGLCRQRVLYFCVVGENAAGLFGVRVLRRQVVQAEHDILRRHDDRLAVGGRQDVVGGHHQDARFQLRLQRKRHVDRHLVAVEVGVKGGADQRMQLDRLAFNQDRLKALNAQAVQGRCAVQHHRMLADDLLQNIPDFRPLPLHHPLRSLDGGGHAVFLKPRIDERLEQLQRHLFGQAALVQFEFRANNDDRAA